MFDPLPDDEYANKTHKFLHQEFGPTVTSSKGIGITLLIWSILGALIYKFGLIEIKMDFKTSYFINENAYIKDFLSRQE